jgi:ribose 5-phosphate isomerase B
MCHDTYSAHQGVEHDDMNVIVFGARIIGASLAYELADAFINAKFIVNEERFTRRFKNVQAIEAKYMCGQESTSPATPQG